MSSNRRAPFVGMATPTARLVTGGVSGPRSFLGPQLRLASLWPDRGTTSQLQNKSNNGPLKTAKVTGPSKFSGSPPGRRIKDFGARPHGSPRRR